MSMLIHQQFADTTIRTRESITISFWSVRPERSGNVTDIIVVENRRAVIAAARVTRKNT